MSKIFILSNVTKFTTARALVYTYLAIHSNFCPPRDSEQNERGKKRGINAFLSLIFPNIFALYLF